MDDWRTVRVMPRAEMLKRVARFKELKGSEKGLWATSRPRCLPAWSGRGS
jgi:hypothetical protein